MAPRTARGKKNTDIKSLGDEVPKKGRGKAKADVEPEEENTEKEDNAKISEKKTKRGKKGTNNVQDLNGVNEKDTAPPAKKAKKKNEIEDVPEVIDLKETTPTLDDNEAETNGDTEVVSDKGRKKLPKKEVKPKEPKETVKGKKNAKQSAESGDKVEEKPKGKGRGRKAKVDEEPDEKSEDNDGEEEKVVPPTARGRKKGKVTQEKEVEVDKSSNKEEEEKSEPEPKKKEPKGRKNAGKKAQTKDESENKSENLPEQTATDKKKNKKEAKQEESEKGDSHEEGESEENKPESKPVKAKRGQKKTIKVDKESELEDVQDSVEPTSKRRRKAEDKAPEDVKKIIKSVTDYESLDFSNSSKTSQGKEWNFKISTWNVDGIRAWLGKGGLEYIKYEKPDILCLQETKCSQDKLPSDVTNLPGYHAYWLCSDKDGYAGVGIYTTKLAMNVQYGLQNEELDSEGRIITAEYEQFYLICTYVPNAGRKLVTLPKRLKWNEEFRKHVRALDKKKPVVICGDMNVAHNEIDLTNPKTNKKNAGFTEEERAGMTELLNDGFVDTFRHYYPDKTAAYTFWTYMFNSRAKNVGWRLDYFIVSQRLLPAVCDSVIRDKVYGSDHCPLSLFLHLTNADKPKE